VCRGLSGGSFDDVIGMGVARLWVMAVELLRIADAIGERGDGGYCGVERQASS